MGIELCLRRIEMPCEAAQDRGASGEINSQEVTVKRTVIVLLFIALCFTFTGELWALCVKTAQAILRVGPGTNYAAGFTVNRYFPLKKVGASLSGQWYAVKDIDGDIFWVHRNLVSKGDGCGAVSANSVNVRTGPGMGYRKVFSMEKYYSFKVIKRNGAWIKVKDGDNNTGWLHRDYCHIR